MLVMLVGNHVEQLMARTVSIMKGVAGPVCERAWQATELDLGHQGRNNLKKT